MKETQGEDRRLLRSAPVRRRMPVGFRLVRRDGLVLEGAAGDYVVSTEAAEWVESGLRKAV